MLYRFQFPSNGKDFPNFKRRCQLKSPIVSTEMFQFPSNGKDFPNKIYSIWNPAEGQVSIPFKREGLSEHLAGLLTGNPCPVFQFPSNGKDFPNEKGTDFIFSRLVQIVSIPFKREGLSEHNYTKLT